MGKNQRKQYFINKSYQTRFIVRFAVITTIWSAAAVALFTYFAGKRIEAAMYSSHLSSTSASELLLPSVLYAQGIAFLLFSFLLAYAIHDLGKRTAAPLFMLKKDIVRIGTGDLVNPVELRPDDEFQDLAVDFEKMRKELGRRFSGIKEKHEVLARAVSGLDRAILQGQLQSGHIDGLRTAAASLKEELHAIIR